MIAMLPILVIVTSLGFVMTMRQLEEATFDVILNVEANRTLTDIDVFTCHEECKTEITCQSLNYNFRDKICRLLNVTSGFDPKLLISSSQKEMFMKVSHPCNKEPYHCKSGGHCIGDGKGNPLCLCKHPFYGPICEGMQVSFHCSWRKNDKIVDVR